ncbi:MAG: TetR/AcrR family transcriptional regulator [Jatrophihabitantaceae bacterium]
MSTPYEAAGRVRQKERTRDALVAATRELLRLRSDAPTVEAAAAAAKISRTTAYRYFPNQAALLEAAHPEVTVVSLVPPDIGDDPTTRLMAAVKAFLAIVIDTEPQLRTMLRLSLEATEPGIAPLRQGRAIGWYEDALEPLRAELGDSGVHSLALAIRSATGIESLVWLTDIGGLSRAEAADLMQWSALGLLRHAMADGPPVR